MDYSNDIQMEEFPVRDSSYNPAVKSAFTRQMVTKMDRSDLEDKFLKLYDENLILKKYGRKRDEEIKQLSAIQIRLENDRKKLMTDQNAPRRKTTDLHSIDVIDQLQNKNIQLEKQISSLKMKMLVLRQQSSGTKVVKPFARINSRIDTGIPKQQIQLDSKYIKGIRAFQAPPPSQRSQHENLQYSFRKENTPNSVQVTERKPPQFSPHDFLQAEKKKLEQIIDEQQLKIQENNQEIFVLKEQLKINAFEHDDHLRKLTNKLGQDKSNLVQDNVERIRLERELKEKSLKLEQLFDQYINLEDKMRTLKSSNDQLVQELENMNALVKKEQNKSITLQNQIKVREPPKTAILELQTRISDLEQDCEILKEANEKLMHNAFDVEKEREWRKRENALKVQIAQLEATLKADVGEKGGILDRLNEERDQHDKMQEEHREMRLQYFELKQKYDEVAEKISFFTMDSAVNHEEIEEALTIVKQRRSVQNPGLDFLQKVDEEQIKDSNKRILELQAEHAETINELEKTRNMLILQYKINKEYHAEVELMNKKMEENKKEFDVRLDQYAQLLDIRADRIRKLEAQMRDVAYGTRQRRIRPQDELSDNDSELHMSESMELERGQNLFEIHIGKLTLTQDALKFLKDSQPNIFCTWEFYEFEIQASPVLKGPKAEFDFTSQYTITVDDFFLRYIHKNSCLLELHQSFGTAYRTIAACTIQLKTILDKSNGRMHGTVNLTGVDDLSISFGTLDYWIRIRVPMEEALRLFKERSKALGYLESNLAITETPSAIQMPSRPSGNINQLEIVIISCSNLISRNKNIQPSPYCVYQFFNYPDHDTQIVVSSNNPQFNDQKIFPVTMDETLNKYLKSQMLQIFVLDDTDPDNGAYLGLANIPMISLSHDKVITGNFDLNKIDGTVSGQIEISLQWKFAYIPCPSLRQASKQESKDSSRSSRSPVTVSLLPGEEEGLKNKNLNSSASKNIAPNPRPIKQKPRLMESQDSMVSTQGAGMSFLSTGAISEGSPVPGESAFLTDTDLIMTPRERPLAKQRKSKTPSLQSENTPSFQDEAGNTFGQETISRTASQSSEMSNEDDVIVPMGSLKQSITSKTNDNKDIVTITVAYVSLCEGSPLLKNNEDLNLYVAYQFLDVLLSETETPYSLPKPTQPNKKINFNFTKVFKVDFNENYERRQYLARMLLPDDEEGGRIRFTLVSEPENDEADCEDIGVAFFNINDILKTGKDFNSSVPIVDVKNSKILLGNLGLTIECLNALIAIKKELSTTE